jgi:hypothetical protein
VGWYPIVKRINGRLYLYLQQSYRLGKRVKTRNKYIGPYSGRFASGASSALSEDHPASRIPASIRDLEKIKKQLLRTVVEDDALNIVQEELDYAHAVRRDQMQQRAIKKKTKGIKAENAFLAQGIKQKC